MNGAPAPANCPFCQQPHPEDVFVCPTAGKILPLEGRLLDGKFRFTKLLGAGGMGAVWKAQNVRVRKAVAIKLMHPEFAGNPGILERFQNEATAAGRIGNPHICDIYDFGPSVLGPYIVLEMLNGRSLGELVQQSGRVDPGLAVLIIRQALIGLDAAHAVGIVHRDLKPENIFLHEPSPGHLLVKLMDFGISKFSEGGSAGGRTSAGVLMGTPEYMSPEQTEGAAGVDQRTDIWAMGAILYKALTGADAFSGASMAAILVAVATKQPAPISQLAPHVPPELIAVVEKCLAKDPAQRYASCSELSFALAPFEQLGAPMPAIAPSHTQAPMTAPPPMTGATSSPPQPQATVITGGPPPTSVPPPHSPQATVITGGPPSQPPSQQKPTWSGEIAQPKADDSWSLGGASSTTSPPQPTSGGGGGKGIFIVLALLLVAGGGAGVFLMMKPKPPPTDVVGPAATTATAATTSPPETKVETPPATTAGDTKVPDTKTGETAGDTKTGETAGDTKTGETAGDTKTGETAGETKTGETGGETKVDDKKGEEHKTKTKPKELIVEVDIPGTRLAGKMLFEKAKEHCDSQTLGGIKSWRLPRTGELAKLKSNAKLAGRKFWSSEQSAGRVKVYDMATGAPEEVAPNTPKIDVVCVALK